MVKMWIYVGQWSFGNEHVDFADENWCLIEKDNNPISPLIDGFSDTPIILVYQNMDLSHLPLNVRPFRYKMML